MAENIFNLLLLVQVPCRAAGLPTSAALPIGEIIIPPVVFGVQLLRTTLIRPTKVDGILFLWPSRETPLELGNDGGEAG